MKQLRIIPAIDIIDGELVRLYQGDYEKKTVYSKSPKEMAIEYHSMGLSHIHVVDLNGASDGRLINLDSIRSITEIDDITIQVGGGIRSLEHAESLFSFGVSSLILGSIIVHDFELAKSIILAYPNQIITGLDVKDMKLSTNGWTSTSDKPLESVISALNELPIQSILSTDISRDGTFPGVNTALYAELSTMTSHSIVASGGVHSIQNIQGGKRIHC